MTFIRLIMPYKDPKIRRQHQKEYYQKNKDKKRDYQRNYCKDRYYRIKNHCPEEYQKQLAYFREINREYGKQLKLKVISHYSNGRMACANPFGEHKEPYTNILALTLDHINGDGSKRKGYGNSYYRWLKKNGFPDEGLQVLCMNCQWIKRHKNHELRCWTTCSF